MLQLAPAEPARAARTAHEVLWPYLREGRLGWDFQEWADAGGEVVDFYASILGLAVRLRQPAGSRLTQFETEARFAAQGIHLVHLCPQAVAGNPWRAAARIRTQALRMKRGTP